MSPASTKSDRVSEPRTSVALLTIMLVMAGMTAGMIEHAAARAVESANRDYRMVERSLTRANSQWAALRCDDHPETEIEASGPQTTPSSLAHLAGGARDLDRRLRNLPPPTHA